MTNIKIEKIQDKIKKLLALSESENQHEAELAMKRAQDLMTKYNIEMAEVLIDISPSDITEEKVSIRGAARSWVATLALSCGNMFDCKTVQLRGTRVHVKFYGSRENIQSAAHLYRHLYKSWMHIARHDYKIYSNTNEGSLSYEAYRTSHGNGFSRSIYYRVEELLNSRKEELVQASSSAGLVPVKMADAIDAYIENSGMRIGKGRKGTYRSNDAFASGKAAGNNVAFGGAVHGNAGYLS